MPPPRVVFIMADDLGYGDAGCYGHPSLLTPYIDSLATNGRKFTHYDVTAPNCSPARGGLMTGRHSEYSRIFIADVLSDGIFSDRCWMPPGTTTVAHWCKMMGAATFACGKWHLGVPGGETGNLRHAGRPGIHGFDEYWIHPILWGNVESYNDRPWLTHNFPNAPIQVVEGHATDITADKAIEFIQNHAADPGGFLCQVWFHAPHEPHELPPGYTTSYPGFPAAEQLYYDAITHMDQRIGDIIAALTLAGILEDTYIVFTSDNGPEQGTPGSAGGLRGPGKRNTWRSGVAVPMIVQGPGITPGSVDSVPRWGLDWLPTCGEIFGFDASNYEGTSLLATPGTRDLFWAWQFSQPGGDPGGNQVLQRGYIRCHHYADDGSVREFYDVTNVNGEDEVNKLTIVASGAGAGQINLADADSMSAACVAKWDAFPRDENTPDPSAVDTLEEAIDLLNEWYAMEHPNFAVHVAGSSGELATIDAALLVLGDLPKAHNVGRTTITETALGSVSGTHDTMGNSRVLSKDEWLAMMDPVKRARLDGGAVAGPEHDAINLALSRSVGHREGSIAA